MAFEKLSGSRGMIYVPEGAGCRRKNPCRDCFSCQWCANERCRVCTGRQGVKEIADKAVTPVNNTRGSGRE